MSDGKFCPQCGHQVKADARFCPECGHKFTAAQAATTEQPAAPKRENQTQATPPTAPAPTPGPRRPHWLVIVLGVLALAAVVVVTSSIVAQNKEQAHQEALQSSESRVRQSKKNSESREEDKEQSLAASAKSVVTNMVQNDDDLDAECTDVTIESHDGGNQYSGYAEVEDDYDNDITVDITVTEIKYDDKVSVYIDGDQETKLNDTFYSN